MVRPFEMKDKKAIKRLFLEENKYHHRLEPIFINLLEKKTVFRGNWLKQVYDNPCQEIFVDDQDGVITGLIMITEGGTDDDIFAVSHWIHINEICVAEAFRGRGVGKKLMAYVERYAREIGVDAVKLEVWSTNEPARAFYDRLGYIPKKEIRYKMMNE